MATRRIDRYVISEHARGELEHRGLSEVMIEGVLREAEQAEVVRPGRWVLQSRISMGSPERVYLVRVFVDVDRDPAEVVTAYRTSKIAKYWRTGE